MSDLWSRICFSNEVIDPAFRGVKKVFFHRLVLWAIGVSLALGLLVARGFAANDGLLAIGLLLSAPFVVWLTLLLLISCLASLLLVPRLMVLGLTGAAFYLGLYPLVGRLARWAEKHDHSSNSFSPGSIKCQTTSDDQSETQTVN